MRPCTRTRARRGLEDDTSINFIRLKFGEGIAGTVAQTGKLMNVRVQACAYRYVYSRIHACTRVSRGRSDLTKHACTHTQVADAYAHPLFHSAVDRLTGFRTRSIMCCAIRDMSGRIVAVLQVRARVRACVCVVYARPHVGVPAPRARMCKQAAGPVRQPLRARGLRA